MQGPLRRLRNPALIALMLLIALLVGCTAERAQLRQREQNKELLTRSADAYWHAVRWNYHDKAVEFIEKDSQRGELFEYLKTREGKASINEPEVYMVDLAEDNMSGTAYVSYQLMLSDAESVEERRIRQKWYLNRGRWYLELEPEELKRLE